MRLLVALVLSLLTLVPPAFAQITSATISGTIKDPKKIVTGNPNRYFDTSAFELQPRGYLGNTPRNFLRGPGFANIDLSLVKNQVLAGDTRLQIRLEVFNLFNRPNFSVPNRQIFAGAVENEAPLATAGQVTRTVNTARQIQLGAKLIF